MKINKNTKGFTLIELILVIVILGILGAVAVPKFSGIQESAKAKMEGSLLKLVKGGLQNYAAENLLDTGTWTYPETSSTTFLDDIMDEIDKGVPSTTPGWSYNGTTAKLTYTRDDLTNEVWTYAVLAKGAAGGNANRESYTLTK